jgi:hypothetical protein
LVQKERFKDASLVPNNENRNTTIQTTIVRSKHSSTQLKRLFLQNPAKRRIARKNDDEKDPGVIPESTLPPVVSDPTILSNGWNVPQSGDNAVEYPFRIARTGNKPNNAVGFLPVYSEYR